MKLPRRGSRRSGGRIRATVTTKTRTPWVGVVLGLLADVYPNFGEDDQFSVQVEDTVRGTRWTLPATGSSQAKRIRDLVAETARGMSDAELDEWSATGRWTTLS